MAAVLGPVRELWWFRSTVVMIATPILLSIMLPFYEEMGLTKQACNCLYMLLLMAVYWCTETLPLAVTSLIPLVLAPLLSIQPGDQVARNYLKDLNVLFLGGLMVAVAIEHSQLHKRIAISVLRLVGTNPRLLMLGFMIPTWFLSMWISNTATTAMMISIVQAVIAELSAGVEEEIASSKDIQQMQETEHCENETADQIMSSPDKIVVVKTDEAVTTDTNQAETAPNIKQWEKTAKALSLSVCYAATCGGIATLTGTPPNLILGENIRNFEKQLGGHSFGLDFASWMGFALPISLIVVIICWLVLQIIYVGFSDCGKNVDVGYRAQIKAVIEREYLKLGSVTWKEGVTMAHFVVLAVLWLSRNPGGAGGWGSLFLPSYTTDGTAAMFVAISLFMFPSELPDMCCWRGGCGRRGNAPVKPREALLTWNVVTHKVPWGLLLLLGGGFALADAINKSGLSEFIGNGLNFFDGWPHWATIMCLAAITAGLTEITSNAAISTIFLPIVGNMAIKLGLSPLYTMLPVCIASSFAFMLPVATPPNALVFATGVLSIKDMASAGIALNIVGVLVSTLATVTWGEAMFGFSEFNLGNITSGNLTSFNSTVLPPFNMTLLP